MKSYVCLVLLALAVALAACRVVPNPEVCCTTDADCARLGGILPRGCPDGQVCRDLRCEAADCATAADCPVAQPVCDPSSASCAGCAASSDCDGRADAPVCDAATGGCRACALDAECASEVCDVDTGRCVPEDEVIYAAPGGADTAGCTHRQPCSVARAIVVAGADPSSSIVRLLPGTYGEPIIVSSGTTTFVGAGALLRPSSASSAVQVRDVANVEIRGLEIDSPQAAECTGAGALYPVLVLRQISTTGTPRVEHAILQLRGSVVKSNELAFVQSDATLEVDRTRFEAPSFGLLRTLGQRMRVRITNSIFDGASLSMANGDNAPDRSEYHVSFNTFVFKGVSGQSCGNSPPHPRIAVLENNIFFSSSPSVTSVIVGSDCTLVGNITYPQEPDLGGTNLDQDPRFVDLSGRDYRLQPGSPAIDAAVPTSGPDQGRDFAGTPRPQGLRKDIGAFELVP